MTESKLTYINGIVLSILIISVGLNIILFTATHEAIEQRKEMQSHISEIVEWRDATIKFDENEITRLNKIIDYYETEPLDRPIYNESEQQLISILIQRDLELNNSKLKIEQLENNTIFKSEQIKKSMYDHLNKSDYKSTIDDLNSLILLNECTRP